MFFLLTRHCDVCWLFSNSMNVFSLFLKGIFPHRYWFVSFFFMLHKLCNLDFFTPSELLNRHKKDYIQVRLVTAVESNPKALCSITTTLRCWGGRYSFPWIAPIYPLSVPYNTECQQGGIKYHIFEFLVWLDLGLNLGLLANTLPTNNGYHPRKLPW